MISHLLFDLDGTLTDSREGIVRCIQHALEQLGRVAPPSADLVKYVGPPLAGSFGELLQTDDAAAIERAMEAYRARFEPIGMFENALYPGIASALAEFSARGLELAIVTAKPALYASRILEHFGLRRLFCEVYGPGLGDRAYTKSTLLRAACVAIEPATAVMIGDRAEDIVAAHENGVRSIGVTWGYGGRAELEAARPDGLVDAPADLVAAVGQLR